MKFNTIKAKTNLNHLKKTFKSHNKRSNQWPNHHLLAQNFQEFLTIISARMTIEQRLFQSKKRKIYACQTSSINMKSDQHHQGIPKTGKWHTQTMQKPSGSIKKSSKRQDQNQLPKGLTTTRKARSFSETKAKVSTDKEHLAQKLIT